MEKIAHKLSLPVAQQIVVVAVLIFAVYCRCLGFGWVYLDDPSLIFNNPFLTNPNLDSLSHLWRLPFSVHTGMYIPVTFSAYWLLAKLSFACFGKLSPLFFHGANLILHLLNAMLVFQLLRTLFDENNNKNHSSLMPMIGALFFGLHPVQVETVAWAMGMRDVLSTFFGLSALLLALRAGWRSQIFALGLLGLALLSKSTAVVFPLALLAIRYGQTEQKQTSFSWLREAVRIAPFTIAALAAGALTLWIQPSIYYPDSPGLGLRILLAGANLFHYLRNLILPYPLLIDYAQTIETLTRGWQLYWLWIIPVCIGVSVAYVGKKIAFLRPALILTFAALIPVLGIVRFDFQDFSSVADRYLYFPFVGVSILLVAILNKNETRLGRLGVAAPGIIVTFFALLSVLQLAHWKDERAPFAHNIKHLPKSALSHFALGAYDWDVRQDKDSSLEHFRAAFLLRPLRPATQLTLGKALLKSGRFQEAADHYQFCLVMNYSKNTTHPAEFFAEVLVDYAEAQTSLGHRNQALGLLKKALELVPEHPEIKARLLEVGSSK